MPGIQGFLGAGHHRRHGVDPQTLLAADSIADGLDVDRQPDQPEHFRDGRRRRVRRREPDDRAERLGHGRRALHPAELDTTAGQRGVRVALHPARPRRLAWTTPSSRSRCTTASGDRAPSRTCPPAFVADATTGPEPRHAGDARERGAARPEPSDQPLVQVRVITTERGGQRRVGGHRRHHGRRRGRRPAAAGAVGRPTSAHRGRRRHHDRARAGPADLAGRARAASRSTWRRPTARRTSRNNDYVALALAGQTIADGTSAAARRRQVVGDTSSSRTRRSLVNVTQRRRRHRRRRRRAWHDPQRRRRRSSPSTTSRAPAHASPLVGARHARAASSPARKTNGFFLQTPDADVDADPGTSEGIFVFTGATPPPAAVVGNACR